MLSKKIKNRIKKEALKKIKKEEKNKYHCKFFREIAAKIPIEKLRSGKIRLRKKKREKSSTEQIKILFLKKYGEKYES